MSNIILEYNFPIFTQYNSKNAKYNFLKYNSRNIILRKIKYNFLNIIYNDC